MGESEAVLRHISDSNSGCDEEVRVKTSYFGRYAAKKTQRRLGNEERNETLREGAHQKKADRAHSSSSSASPPSSPSPSPSSSSSASAGVTISLSLNQIPKRVDESVPAPFGLRLDFNFDFEHSQMNERLNDLDDSKELVLPPRRGNVVVLEPAETKEEGGGEEKSARDGEREETGRKEGNELLDDRHRSKLEKINVGMIFRDSFRSDFESLMDREREKITGTISSNLDASSSTFHLLGPRLLSAQTSDQKNRKRQAR